MYKKFLATSLIVMAGCSIPFTENPSQSPTISPSGETSQEPTFKTHRTGRAAEEVLIATPVQGSVITSPLVVKGKAPGYWFFEATAPVDIVNWNGLVIGKGFIEAKQDWMTEQLVTFEGTIDFTTSDDLDRRNGWVILQRHNASGLPEHDSAVEVPIQFSQE